DRSRLRPIDADGHPPAGLPGSDRTARQHTDRPDEEQHGRPGRGRGPGGVSHAANDRVPARHHRRDLLHHRSRLRRHRPADRPDHHHALPSTGGRPMSSVLFDAPGPRARRRIRILNVVGALVVLGVLAWVVVGLARQEQFTADKWLPFVRPGEENIWTDYLLLGLWNTLRAAAVSIITSLVFGLAFGLGRLSNLAPVRWICGIVVEFFRSV